MTKSPGTSIGGPPVLGIAAGADVMVEPGATVVAELDVVVVAAPVVVVVAIVVVAIAVVVVAIAVVGGATGLEVEVEVEVEADVEVESSSPWRTTAVVIPAASSRRTMTKRLARAARFISGSDQSKGRAEVTVRVGAAGIIDPGASRARPNGRRECSLPSVRFEL
ncbi:MAG: hypothetical protein M3159_01130 [Actinomycetota bacterium]|nr:hypothetical protein [Actinomycetota bacterium]